MLAVVKEIIQVKTVYFFCFLYIVGISGWLLYREFLFVCSVVVWFILCGFFYRDFILLMLGFLCRGLIHPNGFFSCRVFIFVKGSSVRA